MLLFALLFVPALCFSQTQGDTKIIVTPSDTTGLIKKIVTALYDRDYVLESRDEQVLLTNAKTLNGWGLSMKVKVFFRDGKVIFSSLFGFPSSGIGYDTVTWKKRKASAERIAWDKTEEIAKQFGTIQYAK